MHIRFPLRSSVLLTAACLILLPALQAAESSQAVRSIKEIRHQHVVLQQWELSCAAAALATVLRYQHGVPVTERSVALGLIKRQEYLQNPDLIRLRQGFSLLDMKRFVSGIGFQGIGLGQLSFDDLVQRAPIIVPVDLQGFPHFVVFRGTTGESVLLADPAFGNLTLSREKFIKGWIRYQKIGRVGFIVSLTDAADPPGLLSGHALDFIVPR